MLDWVGSLRIRERSNGRVVLGLSPTTRIAGGVLAFAGAYLMFLAWAITPWLAMIPAALVGMGVLLVTLRRQLVVDREAGVLRLDQRAFGFGSESVVPLFHLRAVVVMARAESADSSLRPQSSKFVAYLDRRGGDDIYLDEARRCASLLKMAEVIAEVAELRLEYDVSARS